MTNVDLIVGLILTEARKQGLNYWNCDPNPLLTYRWIEKYGLPPGQHGVEEVLFNMFRTDQLDRRMKGQFGYYVSWVHTRMVRDPHDPIHCASHQSCFTRSDHCKMHKYCQIKTDRWYPEP
jgi:hypothetical protein